MMHRFEASRGREKRRIKKKKTKRKWTTDSEKKGALLHGRETRARYTLAIYYSGCSFAVTIITQRREFGVITVRSPSRNFCLGLVFCFITGKLSSEPTINLSGARDTATMEQLHNVLSFGTVARWGGKRFFYVR